MQDDRNTINIVDIERLSFTIYFSCDNVEYSNNLPTKSIFFPIVLSITEKSMGKAKHTHIVLGISLHKNAKHT